MTVLWTIAGAITGWIVIEFISACIEHLESLDIHGWFSEQKDDGLDQNEKLSGLSGHMVQSLSRHRRTFIILESDPFYIGFLKTILTSTSFQIHGLIGT